MARDKYKSSSTGLPSERLLREQSMRERTRMDYNACHKRRARDNYDSDSTPLGNGEVDEFVSGRVADSGLNPGDFKINAFMVRRKTSPYEG